MKYYVLLWLNLKTRMLENAAKLDTSDDSTPLYRTPRLGESLEKSGFVILRA